MHRRGVDEEIIARDEALRQLEKASIRRHKVLKKKLDEKIDNVKLLTTILTVVGNRRNESRAEATKTHSYAKIDGG